jgi:hypothetical protein
MSYETDGSVKRELELFIDNTEKLYTRHYVPILKNLTKHKKAGKYDRTLAAKAFEHLMTEGAKQYGIEFADGAKSGLNMFSTTIRRDLALEYAIDFESKFDNKEFDFMKES